MRQVETNLDKFWELSDVSYNNNTGFAQYKLLQQYLDEGGPLHRIAPWVAPSTTKPEPIETGEQEYQPLSPMIHNKTLEITGNFDPMSIEEKFKPKTHGVPAHLPNLDADRPDQSPKVQLLDKNNEKSIILDKRTYKVFRTFFLSPTSETGDLPKAIKWAESKRAMARVGFTVKKLQGSAWQFVPGGTISVNRSIQFHGPHSDREILYVMAHRFGRRSGRIYG